MITLICPHCDHTIEVTNIVVQDSSHGQNKEEPIYKTRLEMSKENEKPYDDRRWRIIDYDSNKDRFLVAERKDK